MKYFLVAVQAPFREALTYSNENLDFVPHRGQWLNVPLGKRLCLGLCLGECEKPSQQEYEIKSITSLDAEYPALSEPETKWVEWVSDYYLYPVGLVASTFIPPLKKNPDSKTRKSPVVPILEQKKGPVLNPAQKAAVENIQKFPDFSTHLLFGVTGSGKTEVYMNLLEKQLAEGKKGLILVPEISLTPQLIYRFAERFGDQIAALHSQLTEREKTNQWWDMVEGRKKILIGARSALFCPVPDLGLIIVDEEHEPSYKQDEKLKYHGRDAAIVLAKLKNIPIVLGSATPSLETWKNATENKYHLHRMDQRVENRSLPEYKIIDLRELKSKDVALTPKDDRVPRDLPFWMSADLYLATCERLEKNEQVAFFLNRRGQSQMVLCESCGHTIECPNCDISLTLHSTHHLICHYCDYHENLKRICPDCHEGELKPVGVGTELIETDLQRLFPTARLGRADRDEIQSRDDLESLIERMEKREIDILIGTQMMSKGLDFPGLNLVAFVLADIGFNLPDFRATERSFQLITQMSGRAGRHVKPGEQPGQVIVQAYNPEHESLVYSQTANFEGFAEAELSTRKVLNYPPYGKLVSIRVQAPQLQEAQKTSQILSNRATQLKSKFEIYKQIEVLGPAEAPMFKLRNQFRYHFLIKSSSSTLVHQFIKQLLGDESWVLTKARLVVDVDPLSLM